MSDTKDNGMVWKEGVCILSQKNQETLTDPRRPFRHPFLRMFTSLFIIVMDFFIFGEDPIQDSEVEANLPFVGNVITFAVAYWPEGGGWWTMRLVLVIIAVVTGMYVGRQWIHHKLLRDRWKLNMFSEDMGTWAVMLFTVAVSLFFYSNVWNLLISGTDMDAITGAMVIKNITFGKIAQCGTWLGDLVTVVMVWDSMFQDFVTWDKWALPWKKIWTTTCNGWFRVLVVWGGVLITTAMAFAGVWASGNDGTIKWENGVTNELSRTLIVSIITLVDCVIVIQDWAFPTFSDDLSADIKIAGTFETEINVKFIQSCMNYLKGLPLVKQLVESDFFSFVVTGKWLNYGPLFVIISLDLNMMKNQVIYTPQDFGQYTNPETHTIWTIKDQDYLNLAYTKGVLTNATLISWEARMGAPGGMFDGVNMTDSIMTDFESQSRWENVGMAAKGMCMLPGLISLFCFILSVKMGNMTQAFMEKQKMERLGQTIESGVTDNVENAEEPAAAEDPAPTEE